MTLLLSTDLLHSRAAGHGASYLRGFEPDAGGLPRAVVRGLGGEELLAVLLGDLFVELVAEPRQAPAGRLKLLRLGVPHRQQDGREPPGFPPVAVPAKGTDQSEGEGVEGGEGGQGWSDSHTFPPFSCHFLYRFRGHLCDLLALQRE